MSWAIVSTCCGRPVENWWYEGPAHIGGRRLMKRCTYCRRTAKVKLSELARLGHRMFKPARIFFGVFEGESLTVVFHE